MKIPVPVLIVWTCWTVFLLVWAVMGHRNKKTLERQRRSEMRLYLYPMLFGLIIMALPYRPNGSLSWLVRIVLPHVPVIVWTGAGAAVIGLIIAVWSRFALGRNWSGDIQLKEGHELVTSGPYAAIRHPIYTAVILLVVGLVCEIGTSTAIIGLAFIILSCWVKLHAEEELMLRTFPDSYPDYQARTWRLVPWIV